MTLAAVLHAVRGGAGRTWPCCWRRRGAAGPTRREPAGRTVVTVRLWDEQVAAAYRESFADVHPDPPRHRGARQRGRLRHLLRHAAHRCRRRQRRRHLLAVQRLPRRIRRQRPADGRCESVGPKPHGLGTVGGRPVHPRRHAVGGAAADRCRHRGVLQRRPARRRRASISRQLLARCAGIRGDVDTLRPLLARLTVDADGRRPTTPGFDAGRIRQWGYNAANDLQGIYLNYIGSAGGVFSDGDRFAFDNPAAVAAFDYLVRLINDDHVAPPASDTNDNGDFSRNQFLAGQDGAVPVRHLQPGGDRRAGRVPLGGGDAARRPGGRVSVTNGIAAAGNRRPRIPMRCGRCWPGWAAAMAINTSGGSGAAIPAVLAAQRGLLRLLGCDAASTSPRSSRCSTAHAYPRPAAPGFPAGNQALKPYFDEMFLGPRRCRPPPCGRRAGRRRTPRRER